MTKQLNWRRAQTDVKAKRSVVDDAEFRSRDAAARWLERNEKRPSQPRFPRHQRIERARQPGEALRGGKA